jgi:hypothetical protein
MRSLVSFATAGVLVAAATATACGSSNHRGAGGETTSSGPGGGAATTSASSSGNGGTGGMTAASSTSASSSGTGGASTAASSTSSSSSGTGNTSTASSTSSSSSSGTGGTSTASSTTTTATASSSSGAPMCTGTEVLCASACVDLTTDGHDCGACGHDCLGGACNAGQCAATDVFAARYIEQIAVDATNLYYATSVALYNVPLAGGAPLNLSMPMTAGGFSPTAFVIDSTYAFWTSAFSPSMGLVLKVSKNYGGTAQQLVNQTALYEQPYALALNDTNGDGLADWVIWVGHGDGQSSTMPTIVKTSANSSGNSSTVLAYTTVKFLNSIALDKTSAYALSPDTGSVLKVPLAGGAPVVFATGFTTATHVVADAQNLYVLDLGPFQSGAFAAGRIVKVPLDGTAPVDLASGLANLGQIVVGGGEVYVTSEFHASPTTADGSVIAVPVAGGAPLTIASGQSYPEGIAVDATYVYWANYGLGPSDGGVRKAPR